MRVAIPHKLGKEEARRRLRSRSHEIAGQIPGGMAEVATAWPDEDRMTMRIAALNQTLHGAVEVGESELVLEIDLPAALGFVQPLIEKAVRQKGAKLLAGPGE